MDIPKEVNDRIDSVLNRNKFHEIAMSIMAVFIFTLGFISLLYGIYTSQTLIILPSTLITAFIYWPINRIDKIRKENISLAVAPSLIATLPPDDAARELIKLLSKLQ